MFRVRWPGVFLFRTKLGLLRFFLVPCAPLLSRAPPLSAGVVGFHFFAVFLSPKNTLFWGAAVIIIVKYQTLLAKIALRW